MNAFYHVVLGCAIKLSFCDENVVNLVEGKDVDFIIKFLLLAKLMRR